MRQTRAVEGWTLDPLNLFIAESGARLALIMTPSGQVLAQHGFTRAVDVMAAAALGAAICASSGALARMVEEEEFRALSHQGRHHGVFLAGFETRRGPLLALVVYGTNSSIGLVQLFFGELARGLAAAAPLPDERRPVIAANFENELNRSLASLFGR